MKFGVKHLRIAVSLIMLVTAVLCVFNVTNAYFTATVAKDEPVSFSNLDVRFVYKNFVNGVQGSTTPIEDPVLELFPATGVIEREVPFQFSLTNGGDPIANLGIRNATNSCDAYVRLWVDAFIVNEDESLNKTINYGKYFEIPNTGFLQRGTSTNNSAKTNEYYYIPMIVLADGSSFYELGNTMTLKDLPGEPVPVEILGEKLHLFINFEAVQQANSAFIYEFDDEKGYYTGDEYIDAWY